MSFNYLFWYISISNLDSICIFLNTVMPNHQIPSQLSVINMSGIFNFQDITYLLVVSAFQEQSSHCHTYTKA